MPECAIASLMQHRVNESLQHQPLVALLVAVTLGCMLGLLLARR